MPKFCVVTGKKSRKTVDRSHSLRSTIRRRGANLQKKKVKLNNGKVAKLWFSARALRTAKKKGQRLEDLV